MEQNISAEKVEATLNKIEQLIRDGTCWIIELRSADRLLSKSMRAGSWLFADWVTCSSRYECKHSRGAIISVTRNDQNIVWRPIMYGGATEKPLSFAFKYHGGELWYIAEYVHEYYDRDYTEYEGIFDAERDTLKYIMRATASTKELIETHYYYDDEVAHFRLYDPMKELKMALRLEWSRNTATVTPFIIDGAFIPDEKILEMGEKICVIDLQQQ